MGSHTFIINVFFVCLNTVFVRFLLGQILGPLLTTTTTNATTNTIMLPLLLLLLLPLLLLLLLQLLLVLCYATTATASTPNTTTTTTILILLLMQQLLELLLPLQSTFICLKLCSTAIAAQILQDNAYICDFYLFSCNSLYSNPKKKRPLNSHNYMLNSVLFAGGKEETSTSRRRRS